MNPKITVRIAIFVSPKQRPFPFKQKDKIEYLNLDSARTPISHNQSMSTPVLPQDGLDAIDCNANEDNSNEFISAISIDFEHDTTENSILFSQKHLNDLIRDLCLSKEKKSSLHQG